MKEAYIMKKSIKFSIGVKVAGAAVLGIVLSLAVFMSVKAQDIAGNITEADLSETEDNNLTADTVLTINNDKTINSSIVLNTHNLTINGPINGTKTLTINGRIRPGGSNHGGDLTVNNGVKIVASYNDGHTVYVDNINVDGGSLKAEYNGNVNNIAAIHAYSTITMSSGEIEGVSTQRGISTGGTTASQITGGKLTAKGGVRPGILIGSGGLVISGDDTVVKAESTSDSAVFLNPFGNLDISGGTITAKAGGGKEGIYISNGGSSITGNKTVVKTNGLYSDDDITIADGASINSTDHAITAKNDINISDDDTVVKATTSDGAGAIRSTVTNTITINAPLAIIKPSGGQIVDGVIKKSDGAADADDVEIRKSGGGGTASDDDTDDPGPGMGSGPAVVNKDAIHILSMTGLPYGTFFARQEQGIAAKYAFKQALPKGCQEAFTFNLITNGHKGDNTLKKGKFTIGIPAKYRRAGRTFALQAIDKNGNVVLLPDKDNTPDTITVDVDLEGYAFEFIYKD